MKMTVGVDVLVGTSVLVGIAASSVATAATTVEFKSGVGTGVSVETVSRVFAGGLLLHAMATTKNILAHSNRCCNLVDNEEPPASVWVDSLLVLQRRIAGKVNPWGGFEH